MIDNNIKSLAKGLLDCYEDAYKLYFYEVNNIIFNKIKVLIILKEL